MSREVSSLSSLSPLSAWQQATLVVLRTLIGWHFLYEGYFKFALPAWSHAGQPLGPWSSQGFVNATTGPLGALARSAAHHGLLAYVDQAIVVALLAIGLSLMLGLLTRWGCTGALALLGLFYFAAIPTSGLPQTGAEGSYLLVNKTLIEGIAVLVLASFDTGRIAGLDRLLFSDRKLTPASPAATRTTAGPPA